MISGMTAEGMFFVSEYAVYEPGLISGGRDIPTEEKSQKGEEW